MSEIRLNKYLAENAGVSRREADRLIERGAVAVNGRTAGLGMKIDDTYDKVELDGQCISKRKASHFFAVNKPVGYISSTVKQTDNDRLVTELVKSDVRLFPMGRLDKDSEGLIILTDDGDLMDKVLRAGNGHEKEYEVGLSSDITDSDIAAIASGGLDIGEGRLTRPCRIARIDRRQVRVVLKEGMNRQIRRMFDLFGYEVRHLKRIRFLNIRLGEMKPGEYRSLSKSEIETMRNQAEGRG